MSYHGDAWADWLTAAAMGVTLFVLIWMLYSLR